MAKKPKGRVVAASMAAGSSGAVGEGIRGSAIEQAMSAATTEALERGITEANHILEIKLAARQRVKAQAAAALIEDEGQRKEILSGIDKDYGQLVDGFAKAAERARNRK